jgi:hypothetical protein
MSPPRKGFSHRGAEVEGLLQLIDLRGEMLDGGLPVLVELRGDHRRR